ncbi:serine protease inhibitor 42Dd-like [Photinus pyralis]|nr:serine protease inhibitor 42Dd-like [Photinus pyralis]
MCYGHLEGGCKPKCNDSKIIKPNMTSTVSLRLVGLTVVILNKQTGGSVHLASKHQALFPKRGNFLVCPISLEALMALVRIGAHGNTGKQISLGLNLPIDKDRILDVYSMLYTNQTPTKTVSRKMYINNEFKISDQYKNFAMDNFQSEIEYLNFLDKSPALHKMNEWIENKTLHLVGNPVTDETLERESQIILFNVVYMHGLWTTAFTQNLTRVEKFFVDNNRFVEIEMLEVNGHLNYFENTELKAQFLQVVYGGGTTSFTIVLPNAVDGLSALESHIIKVIRKPHYRKVAVHALIPKMKLRAVVPFVNILQSLGIVHPFQDNADLSSIGSKTGDNLKIGNVLQAVYGGVEETGSDKDITLGIARNSPFAEYVTFHADHPFMFYVTDETNGVTFMGRFTAPEGEIKLRINDNMKATRNITK